MKKSGNDTRTDLNRHQTGATAGTAFGWMYRLLRRIFRRDSRQGGRAVVTEVTTGAVKAVVACLGASATDATGSYDWIADLAQRPENASLRFYRFAEGGDLAYNGLERVPAIIDHHPDYVIISRKVAQFDHLTKHLPRIPSPQWFRETIQTVVRRLKSEQKAAIALCSLIPIGEDPDSTNPFQTEANRRIEEYSAILKDIACEEAVSYIPLYERMYELILASPGRAFTSFDFLPFYRDVFRQFVLHKSNDEIGRLNGWRFHRDGIHLNSRRGKLLADLVQKFLSTGAGV
jgi:lysophospholipase L1-like esterase